MEPTKAIANAVGRALVTVREGMKVFNFEAAVSQNEAQSSPAEELLALETCNCATTSTAGGASLSNTFSPSTHFKTPFAFPVEISLESPSTFFKAAFSKDLEVVFY
jgi:hypothetical protein